MEIEDMKGREQTGGKMMKQDTCSRLNSSATRSSYRIIYRVQGEVITIAAVIHGKRLLELDLQI
jgi:plasmid stabilization system protein ParE